ncbi:hypothetical protein AMECASPLE_028003 [Ameca splendens]|uniref:Uncharacterized protein n=1 Tax=Ameca splendens TaxID=208324 RepID=A0ABV0ZQ87_9TELE
MKTNELVNGDADQQQSHSSALSLCCSQHLEGARQGGTDKARRPMSRHQPSHNTTDTNPGSVPLAPDCHKSGKASQQDQGEGQTEKSKNNSCTPPTRQGGATNHSLWTVEAFDINICKPRGLNTLKMNIKPIIL